MLQAFELNPESEPTLYYLAQVCMYLSLYVCMRTPIYPQAYYSGPHYGDPFKHTIFSNKALIDSMSCVFQSSVDKHS